MTEPVNSTVAGSVVAAQYAAIGIAVRRAASDSLSTVRASNPEWHSRTMSRCARSADRFIPTDQGYDRVTAAGIPLFWNIARGRRGAQ
ncbi:hypothetical protein GCM10027167_48420 [Nocardia heshunensis]